MDIESLNAMFPDEYKPHSIDLEKLSFGGITQENCADLAADANLLFDFFSSNPKKSGFYFVDWRITYSYLDEFLKTIDICELEPNKREALVLFQSNYGISAEVLYERLGIEKDEGDGGF